MNPKKKSEWYEIKDVADGAEVWIYGPIGKQTDWMGNEDEDATKAADFIESIKPYDDMDLTIHLNSPGGEVFEGVAIATAISHRRKPTTCSIEGIAASTASFIATVCDKTVIAPGAMMMVHSASAFCWGNSKELLTVVDQLRAADVSIAGFYSRKSGAPVDDWLEVMDKVTWYTDQQALDAGLVDEIDSGITRKAAMLDRTFVDRYGLPRDLDYVMPAKDSAEGQDDRAAGDTGSRIDVSDEATPPGGAAATPRGEVAETEETEYVALASGVYNFPKNYKE